MKHPPKISLVRHAGNADPASIHVTLYEHAGEILAWYIGPLEIGPSRISMPFLAKSSMTRAAFAIVAAMEAALVNRRDITIVDPSDLWVLV